MDWVGEWKRFGFALAVVALVSAKSALAVSVEITQPSDGAIVSGVIIITGTTLDLPSGLVAVSIDGGAFQNASGLNPWSFSWDTASVTDGAHQITARARQCPSCTPAFDSINVTVANAGSGLSVTVTAPTDGAVLASTFTMQGISSGAVDVAVAVDAQPFVPASGVSSWSLVFEPGSISDGPHTLTARARDAAGAEAFDSVNVSINTFVPGQQDFSYTSSVDQSPLDGLLYVPPSYNPNGAPVALVCFLHGGGGLGTLPPGWSPELDARGWIFIAPDGRNWPLADPNLCPNNPNAAGACSWCTSAAYLNNPFEPMVGPGEQDIFDAINWAVAAFNIDPDRIYLTGFSMGGRGTYQIGLRNPDRFAAIAPLAPAADMYEIFVRRPDPPACKEGMVSDGAGGGQPNDSLVTDTLYSITSGRFLIENAFNLPVFHGHGTADTTACNIPPANGACPGTGGPAPPGAPQYRHGYHMLFDSSWSDCHWGGNQCFGHTPTLSELRTRHPSGYDWGYVFSNVAHTNDSFWATGGADTSTTEGIPSIATPGELMGMFEFFDSRTLVHSPDAVVYKSFTPEYRKAYWVEIDIGTPWQDTPGAIRATRDSAVNMLSLELMRVATATIDLPLAGLSLAPAIPLTVNLGELNEAVYDPALLPTGEPLAPSLVLRGDFSAFSGVIVLRDGTPVPSGLVDFTNTAISIGPLTVDAPTVLTISTTIAEPIPTVSGWGVAIMVILLATAASCVLMRKQKTEVTPGGV